MCRGNHFIHGKSDTLSIFFVNGRVIARPGPRSLRLTCGICTPTPLYPALEQSVSITKTLRRKPFCHHTRKTSDVVGAMSGADTIQRHSCCFLMTRSARYFQLPMTPEIPLVNRWRGRPNRDKLVRLILCLRIPVLSIAKNVLSFSLYV